MVAPVQFIPVKVPEFATAYLIQSREAVPKRLLLRFTVEATAPVDEIPVTVVTVPEVAHPLNVLPVIARGVPVEELRAPTMAEVAPVEDVKTPALDKLPDNKV